MTTAAENQDRPDVAGPEAAGQPAFCWRPRDCTVVWANEAGLAMWGAASIDALASRKLDRAMPAAAQLQRLMLVLAPGAADTQDFIFWFPDGSRPLTFLCRKIRHQGEDIMELRLSPLPALDGRDDRLLDDATSGHGLNGHDQDTVQRVQAVKAAARAGKPPPLAPQDAATLAEIARMIRERSDSAPGRANLTVPATSAKTTAPLAGSELAAGTSELLGRLSHELRTPLNAIIGYAELLESEQHGPLGDAKYRDYAGHMLEAARHCLSLVNDLFDLTKVAAGDGKREFSEVEINDVVRACLGVLAPLSSKAGVHLIQDLASWLPVAIVDRRGLRQILLNLVANAVRFTPSGGSVTVATRYDVGVGLSVIVSDTGAGMTGGDLELARGLSSAESPSRATGTGLGLPISRALATASGGSLAVESEPGAGTRVTLFLPMTRLLLR